MFETNIRCELEGGRIERYDTGSRAASVVERLQCYLEEAVPDMFTFPGAKHAAPSPDLKAGIIKFVNHEPVGGFAECALRLHAACC